MNTSITFVVTALNEEAHIVPTVTTVVAAAEELGCDYEIVLVNDGSTDATPDMIDRLAASNDRIRAVHNERNLGLGGAYKRAVALAKKEHVMWICGDNSETAEHIVHIASHVGKADIVVPVLKAGRQRPFLRRLTSRTFTVLVNLLFGLRVGYYNGNVIHRTRLIQAVPIRTNSFAYQAEATVKMLRAQCSYVEVPYASRTYDGLFSNAMKPKNLVAVVLCLYRTFIDLQVRGLVPVLPADGHVRNAELLPVAEALQATTAPPRQRDTRAPGE
jgi:glycosyltransferase involved in cell wall biosynthesis